ncbi:MAG: alpha/beta hydrolase [Chthoniobacterales bacterium]
MNDLGFVHRYLPPSAGSSRVLLLLHGTGGDESDLLSLGRELVPGAALLSPRGKVSENGAPRFFRRFSEGVFDEEDVIRRANELADFVGRAATEYKFDAGQVTAVGYSNGANIAAAMLLLRPEILAHAILFRAMVPLSHLPRLDLSGTRVLLSAGRHDPIVLLENVQRLGGLLRTAGAEVTLQIQEASHGLITEDIAVAKHWLTR